MLKVRQKQFNRKTEQFSLSEERIVLCVCVWIGWTLSKCSWCVWALRYTYLSCRTSTMDTNIIEFRWIENITTHLNQSDSNWNFVQQRVANICEAIRQLLSQGEWDRLSMTKIIKQVIARSSWSNSDSN